MAQILDAFNNLAGGITAIGGGISAVALLVGGIGIMNIMLVSVSERTREIGLRKAMGARTGVVLMQFLAEAVVQCLFGGLVGLTIAQFATVVLSSMPDSPFGNSAIPVWAIGVALAVSAATGVVFGLFPAVKAARLDPIVALRTT